ncbi:MAG: hypothetical protein ACLGIR_00955 [Actinomycetes bacterium]
MDLTIADDWPGAWDLVPWSRPDDWREVAGLIAWDVAAVAAGWVHMEATHQTPARQASFRLRLDVLAETVDDDLPYLLGVGPTMPADDVQPSLPLLIPDDPPLERLTERPDDLSWRMYFWMMLEQNLDRTVSRAAVGLRAQALEDRGDARPVEPDDLLDDERFLDRLAATFGPHDGARAEAQRWWSVRTDEDRALAHRLGEQVALQVECILRDQLPTVLPLLEESLAVSVEDAALGGAIHVECDDAGTPAALRLVSHDGRPRAPVWCAGTAGADLRELIETAGLADLHRGAATRTPLPST